MRSDDLFPWLADKTRLAILKLLLSSKAANAGEIARSVGVKEPSASQQLRLLRNGGLIESERRGRNVFYRIAPSARPSLAALIRNSRQSSPALKLSARNRLFGKVTSIERDRVTSSVTLVVGDQVVQAVITTQALDELGIEVGKNAYAVVKATEVMLMR